MSLKNIFSKLAFNIKISGSLKTLMSFIINSKRYSSKFKSRSLNLNNQEVFTYRFNIGGRKFDFSLRTFKGDIDIFYEIFWRKTYEKHLSYLRKTPKIIIDLGAHIGMTSAYLSLKYPEAKILAIEASLDNFKLLEKNTCPFENIHCIHAAAYSEDGFVNFGNNELSYNQKISDNGILTKAITVESLMKNFGIDNIDLMKIDIEGGETDLLKTNTSWLSAVDHIIIEIHHPYTAAELHKDLEKYDFKLEYEKDSVLAVIKK